MARDQHYTFHVLDVGCSSNAANCVLLLGVFDKAPAEVAVVLGEAIENVTERGHTAAMRQGLLRWCTASYTRPNCSLH